MTFFVCISICVSEKVISGDVSFQHVREMKFLEANPSSDSIKARKSASGKFNWRAVRLLTACNLFSVIANRDNSILCHSHNFICLHRCHLLIINEIKRCNNAAAHAAFPPSAVVIQRRSKLRATRAAFRSFALLEILAVFTLQNSSLHPFPSRRRGNSLFCFVSHQQLNWRPDVAGNSHFFSADACSLAQYFVALFTAGHWPADFLLNQITFMVFASVRWITRATSFAQPTVFDLMSAS